VIFLEKPAIAGGKPTRPKEQYLVFGQPDIQQPEIDEVVSTLKSLWIGTGPKVSKFEEDFRNYIGAKNAVAVNSCTAAMHLSMIVAGIRQGDEVITTPMTFAATANCIIHCNARPVFADIEKESMNINPREIEKKITKKTKAIIPVHFAGRPCNMDEISAIAQEHNLIVVEDCAHAIESVYKGRKIGTISDFSCFSFYVTKNLTTAEGGMVTTGNEGFASEIKVNALHGLSKDAWKRYSDEGFKHYQVMHPGFKYNMTDIQAALGIHQLARVSENLKKREAVCKKYDRAFKDLPLILPARPEANTVHARHLYTPLLKLEEVKCSRDDVMAALHAEGIGTGIHFLSLHEHHYYRETFGFKPSDFPNAKFVSDRTFSLPLSPKLSEKDTDDVISAVSRILEHYKK